MNRLRVAFAPYWQSIQHALFPQLECVLGPLTEKQQQLVQTLEVIRIEQMVPPRFRVPGRPPKDRAAMARAFVAKAVYDMPTTRVLRDRLVTDVALRRICGWERKSEVPSESVFSRAFAEFSDTQLPQRVHEALIGNTHRDRLVGHLSRDSTAIEAREKPAAKERTPPPPKRKRGRPKKGEERLKVLKRLDRQAAMPLPAMLDDLPTDCDVGMKKDSKGYKSTWVGYKLHIDVADGQIPISCLLTSASLHDSQAAIPLATLSAERTTNLYDLMDAAYDAEPIRASSAESVGEFWFGQVAKCVIQSDFQCPGGAEPIRPFGDHSGLSVEAFDNATGELPPGSEPVQNQVAVRAQPCGQPPSSGRAASASSGCTSGRGTGRPSTATRSPTAIESPP